MFVLVRRMSRSFGESYAPTRFRKVLVFPRIEIGRPRNYNPWTRISNSPINLFVSKLFLVLNRFLVILITTLFLLLTRVEEGFVYKYLALVEDLDPIPSNWLVRNNAIELSESIAPNWPTSCPVFVHFYNPIRTNLYEVQLGTEVLYNFRII